MGKAIEYALDNNMGLDQVTVTGATVSHGRVGWGLGVQRIVG
jgi:hypothetical protein